MTLIPTAAPRIATWRAADVRPVGPARAAIPSLPAGYPVDRFVSQLPALPAAVAPTTPPPAGVASLFARRPGETELKESLSGGRRLETAFLPAHWRSGAREKQAQAWLMAPGAVQREARALAALSPADRAAYQRLAAATPSPCARLALRELLLAGKLTGSARSAAGASLLTELDRLAQGPLAPGIDARALLADTLIELAAPRTINQGARGTCAATAAQILLAENQPAELVRLLAGLASPAGRVTLAGGQLLVREPGTEHDDCSGRSTSSRLVQAAFMEFANGAAVDYCNGYGKKAEDCHSNGRSGLDATACDRLAEGLSGKPAEFTNAYTPAARRALADRVLSCVRAGQDVSVGLEWGPADFFGRRSGHKVVVTGVMNGRVQITHGHGKVESLTIEAFEACLKNANFPPG